jgi:hypothetical protein
MTALSAWHEAAISGKHDRKAFDCGEPALTVFLRRHARRSHERGGAKACLATEDDSRLLEPRAGGARLRGNACAAGSACERRRCSCEASRLRRY